LLIKPTVFHLFSRFGASKIHNKSIQNPCKIGARKSDAKIMKNESKMEPKSIQNRKKEVQKLMRKIIDFWINFGKSGGVRAKDSRLD